MTAVLFLLLALALFRSRGFYSPDDIRWVTIAALAAALFAAILATLRIFQDRNERPWLIAVLVLLGLVKFLTLYISPFPRIDVFAYPTAAVRYFLSGKMVYSETYRDLYQGEFAYRPGMVYPPGVLYFITPFYVGLRDIRAAFVVADLAGVFLISRIARAVALPRRLGEWFAAVWAAFPVTLFVTERGFSSNGGSARPPA